jgi:hypothetical protein
MKFLVTVFMAVLFCACNGPEQPQAANEKAPAADTPQVYIPVVDYIRGEIRSIDSVPVGILKRVTAGNRTDSGFIKAEEFRQLAQQFLAPELERGKFEQSFTESSFFDESSQLLTFTYQANEAASIVRRVDVLIAPSLQLDKIRSVYMEKAYKSGDTAISSKLYWKAGASFQVATEKSLAQQPPARQQVKVIWDPQDY